VFRGDNIFVGMWDLPHGIESAQIMEELPHVSKANQDDKEKSGITSIAWDVSSLQTDILTAPRI
jgi:hypothetical protein